SDAELQQALEGNPGQREQTTRGRRLGYFEGPEVIVPEANATPETEIELKGTDYSRGYRSKLLRIDKELREYGATSSEHALNKLSGRLNSSDPSYNIASIGDVIDAYQNGDIYVDPSHEGTVRLKNGIAVHLSKNGIIKTVTRVKKAKSTWQKKS
ncbi:MAG: hypothetical protein LBL73_07010, partial [Synergistaceae bacterium]|nr:hypothetical protein [Synergistaceae bacterium]